MNALASADGGALTRGEIARLIDDLREHGTDTRRVEVKAARKGTPELYETLSAFANTAGGLILLGIEETQEFAVTGVGDAGKVASDASSQCSEMEPVLQPTIDIVDVDGAQVVVIDVPALPANRRPCFRRASGVQAGTYLRRHDGDVRATWPEIQLMISEQRQPEEDRRRVDEASVEDFDADLVNGLLGRVRGRRGFADVPRDVVLRRLGAAVEVDGRLVPTVAGLFALGQYPQEFLGSRLCLEYVIRPSEEEARAGVRMGRSLSFAGPIPHMVDDALAALDQDISGPVFIQDGRKRTTLLYPRNALREAIVNAVVHRVLGDMSEASTVEIYPDRLVIANPGGLYGLREHELAELERRPRSISRNAALVKLLEDVPDARGESVVEARATGIGTMLGAMRAAGMAPPRFRDQISSFEVEFPKHTLLDPDTVAWLAGLRVEGVDDAQRLALAMARRGEHLDNATYRQVTGIGDSRLAGRHLASLVERELLVMHGTSRWASYRLPVALPGRSGGERGRGTSRTITAVARRQQILDFLGQRSPASRTEVAQHLGLSLKQTGTYIQQLVTAGRVRATRAPRDPGQRFELVTPSEK